MTIEIFHSCILQVLSCHLGEAARDVPFWVKRERGRWFCIIHDGFHAIWPVSDKDPNVVLDLLDDDMAAIAKRLGMEVVK